LLSRVIDQKEITDEEKILPLLGKKKGERIDQNISSQPNPGREGRPTLS